MSRKNGGIIGPANTPVGGLMSGVASGVWRMNDLLDFVGNSQWPLAPQDIENSTRFNDGSSDYLSRTPSSAGNRKTWTWSGWVKRGTIGANSIFEAGTASNNSLGFQFESGTDQLQFFVYNGSSVTVNVKTTQVFRDVSAWYHLVVAFDTTQATASNRVKLYVNGSQVTALAATTYPSQDTDYNINNTNVHELGRAVFGSSNYFDGYMAEVVLIDGQALDPTSFGEFDSTTGIWKPKKIGAQFAAGGGPGTNGFYLDFKDSSNLGNDASGNNNDYTVNNLTSVDQSTDTCVVNYATLNPLNAASGGTFTLSEGNLRVKGADTIEGYTSSTMGFSQGKWYFECESNFNTQGVVGITFDGDSGQVADDVRSDRYPGNATYSYGYILSSGNKITNSSSSSYGNSLATGDILGVAIDLDNGFLYFSKNGTFQNSGDPTSGSTGTGGIALTGSGSTGFCFVTVGDNNNAGYGQIDFNFGSPFFAISSGNSDANGFGNFEYSVPSGYYALNTSNLNTYG